MGLVFFRMTLPLIKILKSEGEIKDQKLLLSQNEFGHLARSINERMKKLSAQNHLIDSHDVEKEFLFESLHEGIFIFDKKLNLIKLNSVGAKIYKINKNEFIGKNIDEMAQKVSQPLLKKTKDFLKRALDEGVPLVETMNIESLKMSNYSMRALPLLKASRILLMIQDNSKQVKALEMGRDFIANASHELRTPITIIKGFTETLQLVPEVSASMLEDITDKILRNCDRMSKLVKNLLLLADLDGYSKGRMQLCDLVGLMDGCNQTLLAVYPKAIIETLHNKQTILAQADPDLLELAVSNLLQNALKYSKFDGEIGVKIEEKETEIHLSIADKGIGIPKSDLPHIFDRFYTVDKAHSRKLGGAGLGLSIVKRIIEKHDGDIHASSVMGQGTTFTIVLPKAS